MATALAPIESPGFRLQQAWNQECLPIPGVYHPLVAKIAEKIGFRAIYLSGAALSASKNLPDVGIVTLPEFVEAAREICRATAIPLLCDADTGFGQNLNVERTVQLFEEAGAAGIHLEDQEMPKRCGHLSGKTLVDAATMISKIRAAVASRTDKYFTIIARTDARGVGNFDQAISRAKVYLEAGADAVFPEALESVEEFEKFAKEVDAPLLANMTEFGKSPLIPRETLAQMGYKMVLYPVSAYRAALFATRMALEQIKKGPTQEPLLDKMLSRAELYDLLNYTDYEKRDATYFGRKLQ
ncbi:methylisocitrate lyase [Telmatocola sphagniphila]|uniref:Methylisocitrate lyase n=1 Tax=Telmatocola sphagniphila TaxID=1123043 RepID=A0A8E6ETL7_9BACT|nr:methylisocitrate lyase [Telmatocola sphagniphila]QVL30112.1 methylisocitrate lyase [Telmatocola sphagniphila]